MSNFEGGFFMFSGTKKNIFKKKYIYITFKILGAKNRRKNLHKHPGPALQIRPGPGYFVLQKIQMNIFYLLFDSPAAICVKT